MTTIKQLVLAGGVVVGMAVALGGCGDGVGACVSAPVDFSQIGQRVYCYDGWDKADCDVNQAEQVSGANWTFYEGQDCSDRDLTTGSNPYP